MRHLKKSAIFFITSVISSLSTAAPIVHMETSKGKISIDLYQDRAPITVANFLKYIDDDFYNNTIFHRTIEGFMIQGGGYNSNLIKKSTNTAIQNESTNGLSNRIGTISMARTQNPDSATSQFFINTANNTMLDGSSYKAGYAVFGKVISGMDVVYEISQSETVRQGQHANFPNPTVTIFKIYRDK